MFYKTLARALVLPFMCAAIEIPHIRSYFYTGGRYIQRSDGEHTMTDQIYVERLTPISGPTQPYPIVFIHGADQTATNWLNKPDGEPGWASFFLSKGYECYLLDQAARGRSPLQMERVMKQKKFSAEALQRLFTATAHHSIWPQSTTHTQWPGNGTIGDPIFDAYYASTVPSLADHVVQETMMRAAGAALLNDINRPAILIAHSQGGSMAWPIADEAPHLVHAIVAVEPSGPPFQNPDFFVAKPARAYGLSDTPLKYMPAVDDPERDITRVMYGSSVPDSLDCILQADNPPPRQLVSLSRFPVLFVTGESSFHASYDGCTVQYMRQAGMHVEHLQLPSVEIRGNGHMMFLEKNSDQIASEISRWIEGTFQQTGNNFIYPGVSAQQNFR
ncbi:hypothetical protein N7478_009355 [Penicillium angulare]|uniref:uncharacterized protein n=1 Tax=Penicillium angulare TaxID=116970 RepID=UPI00254003CE|nr:uncharacterized protein N7478_009355 [Penicillium angulare]KAJ5266547.1 hypothetical protein N7478_009355 [Penicillium angulare]